MNWETKLQSFCEKLGASHAGAAALQEPLSWEHYESWIEKGLQSSMDYLITHAPMKKDPLTWKPMMKSALVFAFPYAPHPEGPAPFSSVRTALYSQGRDYHHWLKERLMLAVQDLRAEFPEHQFDVHTDSSPILERDLAYRAGLGWFGKNTCLIHPQKGSLFLIGEILTSLEFSMETKPVHDFCGTCTRCLDVCPTGALKSPRLLQPDLCISYWTIESREVPPVELREKFGDWLFGCDLCQTVCPWNQKAFKNQLQVNLKLDLNDTDRVDLIEELKWILESSHNQIQKRVKGSALSRAGGKNLKRNALIVIGNQHLIELKSLVEKYRSDEFLGELADWCLEKLHKFLLI